MTSKHGSKQGEEKKTEEGEREDEGSHLCLLPSFFFLTLTHMHAMSFHLSVSYINLAVNPVDLSDPSAAAAAPRDGGKGNEGKESEWETSSAPSMLPPR